MENNPELDKLFSNLPKEVEEDLVLPSKSKFYKSKQPIRIRPMKYDDEKAVIIGRKNKEDTVNLLLSRCVTGIDVSEILLKDKLFLILKLRSISYGDEYKTIGICNNCAAENDLSVNISELPIEFFPEDLKEPTEVTLPMTKQVVKIRFPRVADEKFLENDETSGENLWRLVKSVGAIEDPILISKFLLDPRMPIKDLHVLSNAMALNDYGVQRKIKFICRGCDHHNTLDLQLGADFFTVNS